MLIKVHAKYIGMNNAVIPQDENVPNHFICLLPKFLLLTLNVEYREFSHRESTELSFPAQRAAHRGSSFCFVWSVLSVQKENVSFLF